MILALALCAALSSPAALEPRREDVPALLARIEQLRDEVSPEVIADLAEIGTREAAEALIAGYDRLSTVWMRREVLGALARFDGVAEAEQVALQKLADAATGERAAELHDAAIDLLAGCPSKGRFFLRLIVDSAAAAGVRERALERHIETGAGGRDDLDWYAQLFELPPSRGGKQDGEDMAQARARTRLRELALGALAPEMKDARLVELAHEKRRDNAAPSLAGIRRIALAELVRRGSKKARTVAADVLEDVTEPPENRVAAARHLYALEGVKVAARFLEQGDRDPSVVPMALRMALAGMLAEMDHEPTDKKLAALLRRAEGETALFCLRALRGVRDERLQTEELRLLSSPDPTIVLAVVEVLGASGDARAIEALDGLLARGGEQRLLVAALTALTTLRADDPEWPERLIALTRDERGELRNAALRFLADRDGAGHAPVFLAALGHADWSTRLTALEILTELRTRAATAAIVDRMGSETGFMLYRFADALWTLSGQPFGRSAATWKRWWADVGAGFEPIGAEELAERAAAEERRRLLASTKAATFFGVRVESKRVLFVLDVSGSMAFPLEPVGGGEAPGVRMDVAKRELIAALSGLEADTLFNLITFSFDIACWHPDGIVAASPETKEQAVEYVAGLDFAGGTNLHGALRAAFADRDVDTIFVLSDGEPEGGEIDDPYVIRQEVAAWNEHRRVTINTIAIGGSLDILEWLAADSGGRYVKYE